MWTRRYAAAVCLNRRSDDLELVVVLRQRWTRDRGQIDLVEGGRCKHKILSSHGKQQ